MQCAVLDSPSASDLRVNVVLLMTRRDKESQGYLNATTLGAIIQPGGK